MSTALISVLLALSAVLGGQTSQADYKRLDSAIMELHSRIQAQSEPIKGGSAKPAETITPVNAEKQMLECKKKASKLPSKEREAYIDRVCLSA